jgi:hypothetical protein
MNRRFGSYAGLAGIVWLVAIGGLVALGCNGSSPFLTAMFLTNSGLTGTQSGTGSLPDPDEPGGDEDVLESVCDLDENDPTLRGLTFTLQNESEHYVRFSLTFVASAGAGGFVCEDELQNYLNAGYQTTAGNTVTIGCDTITLGGSQILTREFGINQGAGSTLPPATIDGTNVTPSVLSLRRLDNGNTLIPLPEIIVFGNEDSNFVCTGGAALGDLCSQRGFVYSTVDDIPVGKSIDASRIQGTVCNAGFGSAPEWRLDKTLETLSQGFQYTIGGTIVCTILNRSDDSTDVTRNQAVWVVTDENGDTVHNEAR